MSASSTYIRQLSSTSPNLCRLVVKDNFSVAGFPTSWGYSPPAICVAKKTADAILRLTSNNYHLRAMTNLEPLAIGASGENPFFGTMSHSEKDNEAVPKTFGSSGGVAIAIRNNEADIGLVTDIAGSARLPAISAGLYGLKLKSNEVSAKSVLRLHEEIDCLGLIARDIEQLQSALSILSNDNKLFELEQKILLEPIAAHIPFLSKLISIHQGIISSSVGKILSKSSSRVTEQLQALETLSKGSSAQQITELRQEAKSLFPKSIVLKSQITTPLHDISQIPHGLFQIANVLDWSAMVLPLDKNSSVHLMTNENSNSLLAIARDLVAEH